MRYNRVESHEELKADDQEIFLIVLVDDDEDDVIPMAMATNGDRILDWLILG